MKKKSIKKLELKKVTVIKFEAMKNIKGGTDMSCGGDPDKSQVGTYGTNPLL